jgi:endonuclease/exonuclease/phosphatase family metal-dependent hydrolase
MRFSILRQLLAPVARSSGRKAAVRGGRLSVKALEDRSLPSATALGHAAPAADGHVGVSVMTYNLNDGSDLVPILTVLAQDQNNPAQLQTDLPNAVSAVLAEVTASNIPERAQALATEIGRAHPDLVGVQEATVWSVNGTPRFDMLTSLVDALQAQGLPYALVQTAPAFGGALPDAQGDLVGLQDQNAILVRTDLPPAALSLANEQTGYFTAHLDLPIPGVGVLPALRSWQSVDVTSHGQTFRFINTHLESNDPTVNDAQAKELLAGPANTSLPVILVGDFNAAANGAGSPTYHDVIAGGFEDAWREARGYQFGYTFGRDITAPTYTLNQRIDLILFRGPVEAERAHRVGSNPADRTPSGLWPSDHLGVEATLELGVSTDADSDLSTASHGVAADDVAAAWSAQDLLLRKHVLEAVGA